METPQTTRAEFKPGARDEYLTSVAPEAVEIEKDRLRLSNTVMLPLSVRATGIPGAPDRAWARIHARDFAAGVPSVYSVAIRRELPDALRTSLRVRRTLFEGVLLALAEKTGRRPSRAEQHADTALDEAESRIALGDPVYRITLLAGLMAPAAFEATLSSARRLLESRLRARGFLTQRLTYIPERALLHFQPGGLLFPGIYEPVLMLEEAVNLLPEPSREVSPPPESVWLGSALRDGRDVYFSPRFGLGTDSQQPPHATTLILGEMGSGKTSLMRSILLQRLLQGRRVISLDPEGENNRLCAAMGGRVVPAGIPDDPSTCLLQPLQASSAGELLFATRFLLQALAGETAVSPRVQAALHDIVQAHWDRQPGETLQLSVLLNAMRAAQEEKLEDGVALLKPFASGGLWDGFFDREKALLSNAMLEKEFTDQNCPWWNFDLSHLREENKNILHALLTWFLYRVIAVSSAPLDVYLDEGWRLLRSTTFSALLDELGRRARKRGMGVMLATHLPEDLNAGTGALGLASMAFVGRMGPVQAERFLQSLGIPGEQASDHAKAIARLAPHSFYAVPAGGRGSLFGLRVRLPSRWLAWWQQMDSAR